MALNPGTYVLQFLQGGSVVDTGTFTLNGTTDVADGPLELRTTATHVQWRIEGQAAWNDLVPIEDLRGPQGEEGRGVEMRTSGDLLQWRRIGDSSWTTLYDLSNLSGGGGGGDVITVSGDTVTTEDYGFSPSSDADTDQTNLQNFINAVGAAGVEGIIDAGNWRLHDQLWLPDGIRLRGRGMGRTILEGRVEDWDASHFTIMRMDPGNNDDQLNTNGCFLKDFQVIGADKNASDSGGGLIRLHGLSDFDIKRLRLVDASSYGLFISGYGIGSFTNDINSSFWNSTHRGRVTGCHAIRGQIGFGMEGGAEGVLWQNNHTYDSTLHGFRFASGYGSVIAYNRVFGGGTGNGILLDRQKDIVIHGNIIKNVERGIPYAGFDTGTSNDGDAQSKNLTITGNQIETAGGGSCITDAYHGGGTRNCHDVVIQGNILKSTGYSIQLLWSRKVNIQGNSGSEGAAIRLTRDVSGIVGNNLLPLSNSSSGTVDIGGNVSSANME